MAKNRSHLFKVSGTIGGVTYVHTRKGSFIRAPRGTYKKAEINEGYKAENSRNKIVNTAAKLVHDVVKVYANAFKKSDLWQDMLSRIRMCKSDDLAVLLEKLEGMEVNPKYALERIVHDATVEAVCSHGIITLTLGWKSVPDFAGQLYADGYCFELCVLFGDDEGSLTEWQTISTSQYTMEGNGSFETAFEMPVTSKYYGVVLAITAQKNNKPIEDMRATGMRVMKTGSV